MAHQRRLQHGRERAWPTDDGYNMGVKWTAMALAALVLLGCERKAPGPRECQALAYRLVGIDSRAALADARVKAATDRIIVECLTVPYDRQLLRCVESRTDNRVCMLEMRTRLQNR